MSTKIKFARGTAKYTWQDCKTNAEILSELKINSDVKNQNYINKWINMFGKWTETDRLPHLTLCHFCLKLYCMGRKTAFISAGI
jgi:endonuclease III